MIAFFLLTVFARANVPLDKMEELRKLLVVTRVFLSDQASKVDCHIEEPAVLGAKLKAKSDNFFSQVDSEKLISERDIPLLKQKIQNCVPRASCWIYVELLKNDSRAFIQELSREAKRKNHSLSETHYLFAFKKIRNACGRARSYLQ